MTLAWIRRVLSTCIAILRPVVTLILSRSVVEHYCLDIEWDYLRIHSSGGAYIDATLYRPRDVDPTLMGKIPCIVIVDTHGNQTSWSTIAYQYASQGFAVILYLGRKGRNMEDIFSMGEVHDLDCIYPFILAQHAWIDPNGVFIMGKSYASGIVLRCLALKSHPYVGGIVLSPIPYISSIVSREVEGDRDPATDTGHTLAVSSHLATKRLLVEMGVGSIASYQFVHKDTPADLMAQRMLVFDTDDRERFQLNDIDIPLYVHVNMLDSLVHVYDTTVLFESVYAKQTQSCIRYVHGDHCSTENSIHTASVIYDQILQWCRAVLHTMPIQTFETEVRCTTTRHTHYSSLHPNLPSNRYTLTDPFVIKATSYLPDVRRILQLDGLLRRLSDWTVPIRSLVTLHSVVLWNFPVVHALDMAGFPVVNLKVDTRTPGSGFSVTLLEYDAYGFGKRLSHKYIRLRDTRDASKQIMVRMSMVASRVTAGQELVLIIGNYDRRFVYTGPTDATITFTGIQIPYLCRY